MSRTAAAASDTGNTNGRQEQEVPLLADLSQMVNNLLCWVHIFVTLILMDQP